MRELDGVSSYVPNAATGSVSKPHSALGELAR